jgi:cellobiose phosphorylase
MYRVAVEDILGFHLEGGDTIRLRVNLPKQWPQASLRYRLPEAGGSFDILIERDPTRAGSEVSVTLDGAQLVPDGSDVRIPLLRDGRAHAVRIVVGA